MRRLEPDLGAAGGAAGIAMFVGEFVVAVSSVDIRELFPPGGDDPKVRELQRLGGLKMPSDPST